jgi:hypothetical protein
MNIKIKRSGNGENNNEKCGKEESEDGSEEISYSTCFFFTT